MWSETCAAGAVVAFPDLGGEPTPSGLSTDIENDYFRSKFEPDLDKFKGSIGIGVISDTDSQPLIIGSHLGTFAIVTVGRITNLIELGQQALKKKVHFSEMSHGELHPTELVAMLICEEDSFVERRGL